MDERRALPPLDPGPSLPRPYFNLGASRTDTSSLLLDLDAESIKLSAPSQPSAPPPPPELNKDGKPLTKRQIKEVYISCLTILPILMRRGNSKRKRWQVQTGLICQPQQRQTYRDCIAKSRPSDCAMPWTQSDFTVRRKEKEKASKVYRSVSR